MITSNQSMKVIAFISKKGGVGKSTLVCALATYWADRAGKSVAVQDMEVDGLSTSFVRHLNHPNLALYESGSEYDYVLIDTEGNLTDKELRQVEDNSDQVVVPLKLSAADIAKTYITSQLLTSPKKARILLNEINSQTNAWRDRELSLKDIPLKSLRSYVADRIAYKYLLTDGWSAISSDRKALDELEALAWELS